jgi:hypothetical protein
MSRPKKYAVAPIKNTLSLPKELWEWLDTLGENRTQALILLHDNVKAGICKRCGKTKRNLDKLRTALKDFKFEELE